MVGDLLAGVRIHAELGWPLRYASLDRNRRCFYGTQCFGAFDNQLSARENAKYHSWIFWCYGADWGRWWGNICGLLRTAYALEVVVLLFVRDSLSLMGETY